jgi:hypothetical protein
MNRPHQQPIGSIVLLSMALASISTAATAATCCADCNNDGQVAINELVKSVNEALTGTCTPRPGDSLGLLQTGQTTCQDSSGAEIPCAGTGQDGEFREGAPFSYTDNGDGSITDNVTGLMGEALDDGSIHDNNDQYTWSDAVGVKIATLNTTRFAGHTDWRLPNRRELESLVDAGRLLPCIDPVFATGCTSGCTVTTCSCTPSGVHWSSTINKNPPTEAWTVYFGVGWVIANVKGNSYHVRAVRGPS